MCVTGHQTKALLNNSGPKAKRSKLEKDINTEVLFQLALLLTVSLIGAVGAESQYSVCTMYSTCTCICCLVPRPSATYCKVGTIVYMCKAWSKTSWRSVYGTCTNIWTNGTIVNLVRNITRVRCTCAISCKCLVKLHRDHVIMLWKTFNHTLYRGCVRYKLPDAEMAVCLECTRSWVWVLLVELNYLSSFPFSLPPFLTKCFPSYPFFSSARRRIVPNADGMCT